MTTTDPWGSDVRVDPFATNGDGLQPAENLPAAITNQYPDTTEHDALSASPPRRSPEPAPGNNAPAQDSADQGSPSANTADQLKLPLPPGVRPPTMGWPAFRLRWNQWRQIEDPTKPGYLLVPKPNAREQAAWDEEDRIKAAQQAEKNRLAAIEQALQERQGYKAALIKRLKELANLGITPIIIVANNKSSGKSTTVLGVGNTIKWYTQKTTVAFPATANAATATLGEMSGIDGASMSIVEFARTSAGFMTALDLEKRLPPTAQGLAILTEDVEDAADKDGADFARQFVEAVDVIRTKVSVIILDGGNDANKVDSLPLQAMRLAHVINFVYTQGDPVSQARLRGMVKGLWRDVGDLSETEQEFYKSFESIDETGHHVATRDKIASAIVIANKVGLQPDEAAVDFSDVMPPRAPESSDAGVPVWNGTGIEVGWDPSIGRTDGAGKLIPFDLFAAEEPQQIAWLEIAVANFELAGLHQGFDIGNPMVAILPRNDTPSRKETS